MSIKLGSYSFPLRNPETNIITVEKKIYIPVKTGYLNDNVCALSYPDNVRRPPAVFFIYIKISLGASGGIPSKEISF
jgi:hypothetical protein